MLFTLAVDIPGPPLSELEAESDDKKEAFSVPEAPALSERVISDANDDGMLTPTRCNSSPIISRNDTIAWMAVSSISLKWYGLGLLA